MLTIVEIETFYAAHYQKFVKYISRYTSPEIAEDITGNIFMRILKRKDALSFEDTQKLQSYLYRSIKHALVDLWRNKTAMVPFNESVHGNVKDQQENRAELEMMERLIEVTDGICVDTMSGLLIGMGIQEIADQLGISNGAVRCRLFRSRKALRQAFHEIIA